MTQQGRERCRQCGGEIIVTPTQSPWEFTAECGCGRWLISYAHWDAPPEYFAEAQLEFNFDPDRVE